MKMPLFGGLGSDYSASQESAPFFTPPLPGERAILQSTAPYYTTTWIEKLSFGMLIGKVIVLKKYYHVSIENAPILHRRGWRGGD